MPRTSFVLVVPVVLASTFLACSSSSGSGPTDGDAGAGSGEAMLASAKASLVTAGAAHACALTTDGGVRCWGARDKGQLGDAAAFDSAATRVPVQVRGLGSGVKAVSAGYDVTCAVTGAGGVQCWGTDDLGQLGTGVPYTDSRMQASSTPVDVEGIQGGATAVAVGRTSACAVVAGGAVKCWGEDEYGKLGNDSQRVAGDGTPGFLAPVDVVGLTGAVEVAVGGHHACAVTAAGALWCWGGNVHGAIGSGSEDWYQRVPLQITSLGLDVLHVRAGKDQTCAVMKNGTLKCWGDADEGFVGDGMTGIIRDVRSPQDVHGITAGATEASLDGFACAIVSGATRCWGAGARLGNSSDVDTYQPAADVAGLGMGSKQVSVGEAFACALTGDGAIKCWGDDNVGQLGNGGDGSAPSQPLPVGVVSFP